MRTVSASEWAAMTRGAIELARNDAGGVTLRGADGSYIKVFRRPGLFSSARLWPLAGRFVLAAEELARRRVLTVHVVERFRLAATGQDAVMYRGIEGLSVREVLENSTEPAQQGELLRRLAAFIAALHGKGVYFRGLRFDNVIAAGETFGIIDLAATRFRRGSLSARMRARNLWHLLRHPYEGPSIRRAGATSFLRAYFDASNLDAPDRRRMAAMLRAALPEFGPAIAEVIKDSATPPTARRRSWKRLMLMVEDGPRDIAEHLWSDPDALMRRGAVIKAGDRTTIVAKTDAHGRRFILKRANLKNAVHTALHLPLRSRAMWNWLNSARLQRAGIPTPSRTILLEERWGPLRLRSYLLTDAVEGAPLADWVRARSADDPELAQVAESFAKIWHALGHHHFAHRDMKATNFLVDRDGRIWLVDLDGMRRLPYGVLFNRARARDRARFLRNWQDRPEVQALFRARIDRAAAPGQ